MEAYFAHTYLLIFGKLAVGGLLALSVPRYSETEPGFFRSSAAVYLLCAYLIGGGELSLYLAAGDSRPVVSTTAVVLWIAFVAAFTAYGASLYSPWPRFRARAFPSAVGLGFAALAAASAGYAPDEAGLLAVAPFAIGVSSGAVVAGGAGSGMLLGHWYLVETGLDLAPLNRMLRFCSFALRANIVVVLAGAFALWCWPGLAFAERFAALAESRHVWLLLGRAAAWALALILVTLIDRTLRIPQTMAATGLFYILALVVMVGEIIGLWLLFRTGLPL